MDMDQAYNKWIQIKVRYEHKRNMSKIFVNKNVPSSVINKGDMFFFIVLF